MIKEFNTRENNYKKKQEKLLKKSKSKNTNVIKKLLKENKVMNDVKYFKENMTVTDQLKVIEQMKEIRKITNIEKPYRLALLDTQIPLLYKSIAINKINSLKCMESSSTEYYKIKNWVDTFMQIPFGIYKTLDVKLDDGIDKCSDFMENAKKTLDNAVYGLTDAKLQIMQLIGQWIVNPSALGTAIAIKGPMGTGKTTLVKEGISKILGRDYAFIALGGATDSSFLEGHSYTYEGSTWGKIVQILINSKCMNPIIYFDELDKISDTPKGEEITGILTHLTDTTQNSKFHDKYFSDVEFDLSRCLFIFSYNDESKVNPILRDRMYRIHTDGYDIKEKTTITKDYLLPNIQREVKFNNDDIIINDDAINHIVSNYCEGEQGVRNLKRCIEIIYTKLNLYRLMKPETRIFNDKLTLDVSFPMTMTPSFIDNLLNTTNKEDSTWKNLYM